MNSRLFRLISFFGVLFLLSACGESKKTTISGTVSNTARQLDLYLMDLNYMPKDDISYISTKRNADGLFEFNLEAENPGIYYFVLGPGNVKRKFNSEIKKLLTKNYDANYSLRTRRSGSFFLPVYPGMSYELNIDFGAKKHKSDIVYSTASIDATGENAALLKAFWEMEKEIDNIQFAESLSKNGDRSQPKEMPANEATKIINDLLKVYLNRVENNQQLDQFLKNYFINEINYKAKNVLIQYFTFIYYNQVEGYYLGTTEFEEYASLFQLNNLNEPLHSRQFCQFIEFYVTHLVNKERHTYNTYYDLDEMKYETAKTSLPTPINESYLISRINHVRRVDNKTYNKLLSRFQRDFPDTVE